MKNKILILMVSFLLCIGSVLGSANINNGSILIGTVDIGSSNMNVTGNITASNLLANLDWSYLKSVPTGLPDGDNDTLYSNLTGINLSSDNNFSILSSYRLPQGCSINETIKFNTSTNIFECAVDNAATSTDTYNTTEEMQTAINTSTYYQINVDWSNILNRLITAADNIYLYFSGTTLTLNETKLNATIIALDTNETTRVNALYSNASNWNTAYGWGNHSLAGYITDGNTNWDNSYGFITNNTMNKSVDCSNIDSATSNLCTLVDTNTIYNNATGIVLSADNNFSIVTTYRLPQSCLDGEIAEYNSTSGLWECGIDNSAASGMSQWNLATEDTGGSEAITDSETATWGHANTGYLTTTRSTNTVTYTFNESKLNTTISALDTDTTYTAGNGLDLSTTTFSHTDTSSVSNSSNADRTYIQSLTFDTFGHVVSISTATETVTDTLCNGTTCDVTNTGTLDGYEAVDLLDNTDSQTLSYSNGNITITGGNSVNISAVDTNTQLSEAQVEGMIFDADNTGNMVTTGFINASSIGMSNGGSMGDNSTCTIIYSPDGNSRIDICN